MSDFPTIGVCGLGQMGASAAVLFSRAGYPVWLWGRNPEKLRSVVPELDRMNSFLDEHLGSSSQPPGEIRTTSQLQVLQESASHILECIAEKMDQKIELLKNLRPAVDHGAILMSCTSGLSISHMGKASMTGKRLVGAHFWNPPHLMPLVEVISGEETEEGLADEVAGLLRSVGKISVTCRDIPGFIGNRLFHAVLREAAHLVQSGLCTAEEVDTVARLTFALRMPAVGPCENMDLVGLPLIADVQSYLLEDLSSEQNVLSGIAQRISEGNWGMRSGRGFYDWNTKDPLALVEARDRQIIRQLRTLQEIGRLPIP